MIKGRLLHDNFIISNRQMWRMPVEFIKPQNITWRVFLQNKDHMNIKRFTVFQQLFIIPLNIILSVDRSTANFQHFTQKRNS